MPTLTEIETKCREIVAEHLELEPAKITRAASFIDDLGADSLDSVEIVLLLEMEFDIEVDDAAIEGAKTFGGAVDAVATALGIAA